MFDGGRCRLPIKIYFKSISFTLDAKIRVYIQETFWKMNWDLCLLHEIKICIELIFFKMVYKYIITSDIRLLTVKSLTEEKAFKNQILY